MTIQGPSSSRLPDWPAATTTAAGLGLQAPTGPAGTWGKNSGSQIVDRQGEGGGWQVRGERRDATPAARSGLWSIWYQEEQKHVLLRRGFEIIELLLSSICGIHFSASTEATQER